MSQFPRSIFTQEQEIQIVGLYSETASQCLPSLPRCPMPEVQCLKSQMPDVTQILNQIEAGDPFAAFKLLPLVYEELRIASLSRGSARPPERDHPPGPQAIECHRRDERYDPRGKGDRLWCGQGDRAEFERSQLIHQLQSDDRYADVHESRTSWTKQYGRRHSQRRVFIGSFVVDTKLPLPHGEMTEPFAYGIWLMQV